jgi:hypothetical protein
MHDAEVTFLLIEDSRAAARSNRRSRVSSATGKRPLVCQRLGTTCDKIAPTHRGQPSVERLRSAWPTLRLIHLPVHASWLNQVDIHFSVVQRKLPTPNDFHSLIGQ